MVDRYDRAALMRSAQAVQAGVVAVLTVLVVTRQAGIWVLAVTGFGLGSAEVISSNAAQSVLPALVPPEQLPKANGNLQVSLTVGERWPRAACRAACCSRRPGAAPVRARRVRSPGRRRC